MSRIRGCFITLVIIVLLGSLVLLCVALPQKEQDGTISFFSPSRDLLFLGLDEREGSKEFKGRTDTILIFHISNWGEKDCLISIPRDTRVSLEGHGWNKINAAYVYGGEDMIKNEIHELTGINIDKTMVLNFDGFKRIINILGGVEIEITEPLHDPLSGANFDPGIYNMDGEQALSFARCRATARADLDRIDRQQHLLNEIIKQKANFGIIPKLPQIISVLNEETMSDFSLYDYFSMSLILLFSSGDIDKVTIPTEAANIEGISYLIADEKEVKEFLKPYIK